MWALQVSIVIATLVAVSMATSETKPASLPPPAVISNKLPPIPEESNPTSTSTMSSKIVEKRDTIGQRSYSRTRYDRGGRYGWGGGYGNGFGGGYGGGWGGGRPFRPPYGGYGFYGPYGGMRQPAIIIG